MVSVSMRSVEGLETSILELLRGVPSLERLPTYTRLAAERLIATGVIVRDRRGWRLAGIAGAR